MTDFGDRTHVKLIRTKDDGNDEIVNLDLTRSDIVSSPYYYMKQNDILYVQPDKINRFRPTLTQTGLLPSRLLVQY